jgi:hypothetical protein
LQTLKHGVVVRGGLRLGVPTLKRSQNDAAQGARRLRLWVPEPQCPPHHVPKSAGVVCGGRRFRVQGLHEHVIEFRVVCRLRAILLFLSERIHERLRNHIAELSRGLRLCLISFLFLLFGFVLAFPFRFRFLPCFEFRFWFLSRFRLRCWFLSRFRFRFWFLFSFRFAFLLWFYFRSWRCFPFGLLLWLGFVWCFGFLIVVLGGRVYWR